MIICHYICSLFLSVIIFDETKRQANIAKHGLDFVGCEVIFENETFTREDSRHAYGEQRFQTMGVLNGVIVVVVHVSDGDYERIISLRKATKHEKAVYCDGF